MYTLRPITPDDKDALVALHARLSPDSLYRRFHGAKPALSARELAYFTEVDDAEHVALVAETTGGELAAVARVIGGGHSAEAAVVVADDHHGRRLGEQVTRAALERFWQRQATPVLALIQADNRRALSLFCDRLGGRRQRGEEPGVIEVRLDPAA